MPKAATPARRPLPVAPHQFHTAAEIVQKILGNADPCAGYDVYGLLCAYFQSPDARVKINAIVHAAQRSQTEPTPTANQP